MEKVILVDENDNAIGAMDKMEAHRKGLLHRAFSILLFNSDGQILLQKRSGAKYHSGGLWTNTCCSHPRPDEPMNQALRRKLKHEMGIDADLRFAYKFIYKTHLDKNLIENELDHVYIGTFNGQPSVNPEEVEEWKYISMNNLQEDIRKNPQDYTYWFKLIVGHPQLNQLLSDL